MTRNPKAHRAQLGQPRPGTGHPDTRQDPCPRCEDDPEKISRVTRDGKPSAFLDSPACIWAHMLSLQTEQRANKSRDSNSK